MVNLIVRLMPLVIILLHLILLLLTISLKAAALYEAARHDPSKSSSIAPPAVLMLFLFNLTYASTWGTVAFLIPTEIFPSEMRAQGNGFGITGWAIGVGWTTLVNPIMFGHLESRTYFLFAGLNLLWVPIVYLFYPETAGRSLESIEAMFTTGPFFRQMEIAYEADKDTIVMAHGAGVGKAGREKDGSASQDQEYNEQV